MEPKISIYDPAADAFRDVSIDAARKYVEEAERVKAELAKLEGGAQ